MNNTTKIGVLGTGSFTFFSVEAFLEVEGLALAGAWLAIRRCGYRRGDRLLSLVSMRFLWLKPTVTPSRSFS